MRDIDLPPIETLALRAGVVVVVVVPTLTESNKREQKIISAVVR